MKHVGGAQVEVNDVAGADWTVSELAADIDHSLEDRRGVRSGSHCGVEAVAVAAGLDRVVQPAGPPWGRQVTDVGLQLDGVEQ